MTEQKLPVGAMAVHPSKDPLGVHPKGVETVGGSEHPFC
jgi:hypothetical protein